ncbi:hypothetical protein ACQ9BO_24330 [Flavobacterium sp. P21]|uniref:hypothetical protein n=1 Tax=Flavobacterium sp. P21 TaxID=3423948 RepID=UPI003D673655
MRATNSNQAVAEGTMNTEKKNQFSVSGTQKPNQAVAVKNYDSEKQKSFNSSNKNQFSTSGNQKSNQAVAAKSYNSEKSNGFNSSGKNQFTTAGNQNLNAEKRNSNQALAVKNYSLQKQNAFNTASKNQFSENEKKNLDKVLAEKTFTGKNTNSFSTSSKNQLPNSVFENNVNPNNNNIAFNSANTTESNKQNGVSANKNESIIKDQKSEKAIAANTQKNNSKFNDALSKKDSVQLAELQNLEKGIITPEVKTEKRKIQKLQTEKNGLLKFLQELPILKTIKTTKR